MDSTAQIPHLYSAAQIEEAMGVRHGTVHYLRAIGLLRPAPLPGKRARYTAESVRAALAAQPPVDPLGRPAQEPEGGDWM